MFLIIGRTIKTLLRVHYTMLATSITLLIVSILPGYALCKVLDGTADKYRKAMLSPAIGLLLLYGLCGLILLSGLWTWSFASACILLMNTLAIAHLKRKVNAEKGLTKWQKLEAVMHGVILDSEEEDITEEVTTQQWFQSRRSFTHFIVGLVLILGIFILPIIQRYPFGVDWIGFAILSGQIVETGSLNLPGTNSGYWTYPPAFPALSAWLQSTIGIDASSAVFELGHYTLIVLIIGFCGALDHHGAGGQGAVAMALGFGLFAKTYDSGFPTVASQLGLIIGLLVLLRPSSSRGKHHTRGFVIAVCCVALIHPTGAIYLGMLMAAHLFIGLSIKEEYSENANKLLFACAVLITIAIAISIIFLAPRMLNSAVFAEYGWQGGMPMITYNFLLLILGVVAGWKLRDKIEARLLITWIAALWLLTSIHLIEGLENIPVLSLLSYTLYSMGLHAFHIPLAALVALWLSPTTGLTSLKQERTLLTFGGDSMLNEKLSKALTVFVLTGIIFANVLVWAIANHDELKPFTQHDIELRKDLSELPKDSIVYTENAHWGYVFDSPKDIKFTSIPSLGLVQLEESIQQLATSGILNDNISLIEKLGIDYAISSPIGTIGWSLSKSRYWNLVKDYDGSRLWQFNQQGNSQQHTLGPVIDDSCNKGCELRLDPWRNNRFDSILGMNDDYRAFIEEGSSSTISFGLERTVFQQSRTCLFYEAIGKIDDFTIQADGINHTAEDISVGWNTECFTINSTTAQLDLTFIWNDDTTSDIWLNPTGFSGRGDRIIDVSGLRIHWVEIEV